MLRFECPRCQTVFTRDEGGDDAFVECPSCGAMAMSAGEATGVDSDALARTLSSTHDVAALQAGADATADGDAAPERQEDPPPGASDDAEDSSLSHRPSMSDEGEPAAGGGIFNNLLGGFDDGAPAHAPAPRAPSTSAPVTSPGGDGGGLDLGLDDELGDFDFPVAAAPKPAKKPAKKPTPARRVEGEAPVSTPDVVAPPAAAENVAVNLGDDAMGALEAAFDTLAAAPPVARRNSGLSDDERRFLENVMGSAPPPPPPRQTKPPPRPPEKPGVPRAAPPPLKKRPPSAGFALTPEAREAAFIPLKAKRAPPKAAPPPPPRPSRADDPEITAPNELAPRLAARSAHSADDLPALPAAAPGALDDAISKLPSAAKATRAPRPKPSVWAGLHKGALAAAILVGLLAGAGAGAAMAPAQQKRTDGRARAELAVADGNRYYEAARYDDALGKYKNAISNDRTYAPAYRAKGAALAKQGHMAEQGRQMEQAHRLWDEAAAAYREYLALEPSAIDGADIKESLSRRGVAPIDTGASAPPSPAPSAPPSPPPPSEPATPPAGGTDG